MNGIELKVPIRLYWDVSPAPPGGFLDYPAICRDVVSLRILSINLIDLVPGVSEAGQAVLQSLKGCGAAVSLTVAPESLTRQLLDRSGELGVRTVLVRIGAAGQLACLPDVWQHKLTVGICFDITAASWRQIPEVLRYCSDKGIMSLSLPMQRLQDKQRSFYLTPAEKVELAAMLDREPVPAGLKLTIHDPFIWKLFFPQVSFPDGGCQAANTMLYISPAGDVFPCPMLPLQLGNLHFVSFRDIALSDAKKHMRQEIVSLPTDCLSCPVSLACKGGCRGRACVENGCLDSADPGCRD